MNTTRSYMVLNNMDAINDLKFEYNGQFIICPKDVYSLNHAIYMARNNAGSNMRSMGDSKILVITNFTDTSWMFEIFWFYGINNVIILVYGRGTSKLFMCDRFAPENKCGKTAKLMIHQDCEEQLSLSFTSVIHQMNKCPIMFGHTTPLLYENEEQHPVGVVILYVIRELSKHLNATFQLRYFVNRSIITLESRVPTKIVMSDTVHNYYSNYIVTEPLLRTDFVWLVPKARQISNMNVCMQVFNYHVWIATSVVFICVWLMWFLIISRNGGFTFDKLCISFLNVWSLTICGNVAQLPRPTSLSLRILLLFYLFYAINMQFAFTSDMSTVLTAPQYEFQITNLKELADSQLPIYVHQNYKNVYFSENYTDRKLYTKLQNSMQAIPEHRLGYHLLHLHLYRNYAVIVTQEGIPQLEILTKKKVEAYEIKDNSLTDDYTIRLHFVKDHYFTTTLNTFISKMIESGLQEKQKNDLFRQYSYHREKVDKMQEDGELTLKHLTFIFIFLGFGLGTACVVFCFELVLHKYL